MAALLALLSLAQPQVPGLEREGLDARLRGLVLLGELGCTACHDAGGRKILHKTAPDLSRVGARLRPAAIRAFVSAPHRVKPGTTMPDLVAGDEAAAEALTHYLASLGGGLAGHAPHDAAAAVRGKELFHSVGCVACHSPRTGKALDGSVPLGPVHEKYTAGSLAAFLEAPLEVRPAGRMPSVGLTRREALDLAHYLLEGAPAPDAFTPEEAAIKAGRERFIRLNCVRCHRVGPEPPPASFPPLDRVDPSKGCLSSARGPWPSYALGESQKGDLRAALAAPGFIPSAEQEIRRSLAALNCIACHARGDWGGVTRERNEYFGTGDPNLGETGRIPPPLTWVGAKLRKEWIRTTVAYGRRIRPYVKTRMPAFGKDHGIRLAELFAKVDEVPAVEFEPVPEDRKAARAVRDAGRDLLGDKGMKCITCHPFAGRRSSTMMAVDLVDTTTERLRKEWFYHYMLQPARFRPGTIMPTYFPGGTSVMKDVLEGDAKRQIHAIWTYLAGGRNQGPPAGLVRPSMEIVVGDEAVMLRRSVQNTGKRGISVGYPKKVNLTFDAESVALNQIWHGRFIDPAGVWSGQGSGQARPLGEGRTALPKGPAFMDLPDPAAPWTTKTSRELGIRFRGYRLDRLRRPTFLYAFGDLKITDTPLDLEDGGKPFLRRTVTLEGPAPASLHFRAAADGDIRDLGGGVVHVGRGLEIRTESPVVRKAGKGFELLVPVSFTDGRATFTIEYRWREAKR